MNQETDRELLELAAKAVQLPECGWMGPAFMYVKDNTFTDWNPLADDGDALRLAVKLLIDADQGEIGTTNGTPAAIAHYRRTLPSGQILWNSRSQAYESDPYAATRRAIVLAAAEIGKAMP
jgi:hypothetical protein